MCVQVCMYVYVGSYVCAFVERYRKGRQADDSLCVCSSDNIRMCVCVHICLCVR